MTGTIDIIIKDVTLVLPLYPDSNITSISEAAIQEYRKFQLRDYPQKVLYTKDSKGRVLTGSLQLPLSSKDEVLTVVVQDYSQNDSATPSEVLKLYRDWQLWAAVQLKDHIQQLSFRDSPMMPDQTVFQLLDELSKSPGQDVQLCCILCFRFLLCRFPQKSVVIQAAEQISKMFSSATSPETAISALESFKDLSPLQMKLFNSSNYVRSMIDVQQHLVRFPVEARSNLFQAFKNIVSIIEDEELVAYLQSKRSFMENESDQNESNTLNQDDIFEVNPVEGDKSNRPPSAPAVNKKWNLPRLLSLLASEDGKIKLYSLEKIRKVCITALSEYQRAKSLKKKKISDKSIQEHSYLIDFRDEEEFQKFLLAIFQCLKLSIRGRSPQTGNNVDDNGVFHGLSTAGRLIAVALTGRDTDLVSVRFCIEILFIVFFHSTSIMSIGLNSIHRSIVVGSNAMNSNYKKLHHHQNSKQVNPLTGRPLSYLQRLCTSYGREYHRLMFTLSHASEIIGFYQNQQSAEGSLFVIKTIDPYILEEIAERSAFLFAMVILHHHPPLHHMSGHESSTIVRGWASSALQPEHISLKAFLSLRKPCYRLYLALTYLLHLASTQQPTIASNNASRKKSRRTSAVKRLDDTLNKSLRNSVDDNDSHQTMKKIISSPESFALTSARQRDRDSLDSTNAQSRLSSAVDTTKVFANRLEEILCQDQHVLLRILWWWCIADARQNENDNATNIDKTNMAGTFASNFLVRRYAWRILAEASILIRVVENLWQTQATSIPRNLPVITMSTPAAASMLKDTVEIVPFLLTLISRAYRYVPPSARTLNQSHSKFKEKPQKLSAILRKKNRPHASFVSIERPNGVCCPSQTYSSDLLLHEEPSQGSHSSETADLILAEEDDEDRQSFSSGHSSDSLSDSDANEDDVDADFMSDDSYSDKGDDFDLIHNDNNSHQIISKSDAIADLSLHRWSKYHADYGFKIRVDLHLLRALLKTLSNIFQVTPLSVVYFPDKHRQKLLHYLQSMVIGDDNEKFRTRIENDDSYSDAGDGASMAPSSSSSSQSSSIQRRQDIERRRIVKLEAVAERDHVVSVYYHMLMELLQLPTTEELGSTLPRPV